MLNGIQAAAALLAVAVSVASGNDRVAMIIANQDYGPKHAADRSAALVQGLRAAGFEIRDDERNLDSKAMAAAVREFAARCPTNGTAVIALQGFGFSERSGRDGKRSIRVQGAGGGKDERDARGRSMELREVMRDFGRTCGARELHVLLDLDPANPFAKEDNQPAADHLSELETHDFVRLHLGSAAALRGLQAKGDRRFLPSPVPKTGAPGLEWVNGIGMVFCWCPPGKFSMGLEGEDDAEPVEAEISRGFWMARHELTQREYRAIRGKDPNAGRVLSHRNAPAVNFGNGSPDLAKKLTEQEREAGRLPDEWEYRVPTEAQWEYACRAGTSTRFGFGDSPDELHEHANFADRSLHAADPAYHYADTKADDGVGATLALVGSYKPNAWGLHDMHGNVSEWCREFYFPRLEGGVDPLPGEEVKEGEKVVRGGAWCSPAEYCQSGFRSSSAISNNAERLAFLGVRLVLVRVK